MKPMKSLVLPMPRHVYSICINNALVSKGANKDGQCQDFGLHSSNIFNEVDMELERETGFEPATSTLARLRSTN